MNPDALLQQNVLRGLEYEPGIDAAKIRISVADGVVTLEGSVSAYDQKAAADRVVQHLFGVRAVANDLDVIPDAPAHRVDSDIAQVSLIALTNNAAVPIDAVHLSVTNGWVTLTGEVPCHYQKEAAERSIRTLPGVRGVTNNVALKPLIDTKEIKAQIESTFLKSGDMEADRVSVIALDGAVTLIGTVKSLEERREAERAAWNAAGVSRVDNRLVVAR